MNGRIPMHESGLGLRPDGVAGAVNALAANAKENGRTEIIPADILNSDYIGHCRATHGNRIAL